MEVNRQMLAGVLIRRSCINETGGIISLFRLYVVKDCTLVSLNHALHRLIITPVNLDITQVTLNNASVTRYIIQHYADWCLPFGLQSADWIKILV